MKRLLVLCVLLVPLAAAHSGPFDGKNFKGRIAWSCDGNHNDEDDWAASPVALAIFAEFGVKDKLVHFDYNNILPNTDPAWEKEHEISILGAIERYGYNRSDFHDCRQDLDAAVASIVRAINASTADNPLYFVLAGPMEAPYMAIQKSDPAKRRFVYCISHSRWNDGFSTQYTFPYNKRAVIPTGIRWIQIRDQNEFLATSPFGRPAKPEEWIPWFWLRDAVDEKLRFLWERMRATTRADCSDAGMAYFLMTGDEASEIDKIRGLLEHRRLPPPTDPRPYVRLEAENFLALENFEVEDQNRQASHRLSVRLTAPAGRIATPFDQPYTAPSARYDAEIRYLSGGGCRFTLLVDGVRQGAPWEAAASDAWQSQTIPGVPVKAGREIVVESHCAPGSSAQLDYVQLTLKP
jgi:hypothetical protein